MFCPYHWTERLKEFYISGTHKVWKKHQGEINNTYHGGNIENDHHIILSTPEDVVNNFTFPNLSTPGPGNLMKVMDNDTKKETDSHLTG